MQLLFKIEKSRPCKSSLFFIISINDRFAYYSRMSDFFLCVQEIEMYELSPLITHSPPLFASVFLVHITVDHGKFEPTRLHL